MRRLAFFALAASTIAAFACSTPEDREVAAAEDELGACNVSPERSLVITKGSVLGDATESAPGGAFHFATVLGALFDEATSAYERERLLTDAFGGGSTANAWPLRPDGTRDPSRPPYRLVAIAFRPEGSGTTLGELRLVFEAWAGGSLGVLASFEYALDWSRPAPGEAADAARPADVAGATARRNAWIDAVRDLEKKPFAQPAYVAALASLTKAVTRKSTGTEGTVVPPRLRMIGIASRTDGADRWTMTALTQDGWSKKLRATSLTRTPEASWNEPGTVWGSPPSGWGTTPCASGGWNGGGSCGVRDPLVTLIMRDEARVLDGTFELPSGAGTTSIVLQPGSTWGARLSRPDGWTEERWSRARSLFSRATCDGCHGADTGTTLHHVAPQTTGDAVLSAFVREHEIPLRKVAYRAALCGAQAVGAVTPLGGDGGAGGIAVATTCTTKGEVFSEPCNGGMRYAACVELGGKLVVSEKTACVAPVTISCVPGEKKTEPCEKLGTRTSTCSAGYTWSPGWCANQKACEPGTTEKTSAGCAAGTTRTRTCGADGMWGSFSTTCAP